MDYEAMAQRIADCHTIIQTKPVDRLDYAQKTKKVTQIVLNCIGYLEQMYASSSSWEYNEEDFAFIHESVCVAAIPLLDMVEHFLELAEAEAQEHHLAV